MDRQPKYEETYKDVSNQRMFIDVLFGAQMVPHANMPYLKKLKITL
jgi:hypothetical protein